MTEERKTISIACGGITSRDQAERLARMDNRFMWWGGRGEVGEAECKKAVEEWAASLGHDRWAFIPLQPIEDDEPAAQSPTE